MKNLKKEFRVFMVVYAVLVIAIIVGANYVYQMIDSDLPDMAIIEPMIIKDANAFARQKNIKDCIEEDLIKIKPCDVHDLKCRITGKIFIEQCLKVASPVRDYCIAFPRGDEIAKTASWEDHLCSLYPKINTVVCVNTMESVAQYCKSH
ncbi:MAG: hypothetical protein OEV66_04705 [Spirochaetia bacterium]|nr:hypothetical protein [Spirochaetia bacterium]